MAESRAPWITRSGASTSSSPVEKSVADTSEALVHSVGFDPLEAFASATSVGAAAIGVEEDLGSVEVGKVADLVVYRADPSADVTVLRNPSHVIEAGRLVRPRR